VGLGDFLKRLFGGAALGVDELARRVGVPEENLRNADLSYRTFTIPKRAGGSRTISVPNPSLKSLQRRILRRLLARLKCHPAAQGFERGRSIVTNARPHVGKAVVVRMDIRDFFTSTGAKRVEKYFRRIGWNKDAARLLVRLLALDGGLPQGAPTSPRLSNLVNRRLDARLAGLAASFCARRPSEAPSSAAYTRYADDLTFSFDKDDPPEIRRLIHSADVIAKDEGYALHHRRKLSIRRRHASQRVTGLVVNDRVNLPRATRRWLRAVEHHLATGRKATLSPAQLKGWQAFASMVEAEREKPAGGQ